MSGQRYRERLQAARIIWSCCLVGFWLLVIFGSGYQGDFGPFTMALAAVGFIFWPRNKAKRLAARARREEDLNEAVREELDGKPAKESHSTWLREFENRRKN